MNTTCSLLIATFLLLLDGAFGLLVQQSSYPSSEPYLVPLRRESVPVRRRGKIASFKTSYSGVVHMGVPAQEFRVVFDTGSGHIVLPAIECQSESCLHHRRFNMTASTTAKAINMDGSRVAPGATCDQVTIGFGTGEIKGEFVADNFCLGPANHDADEGVKTCVDAFTVVAVEMSTQPFKTFGFDGILGLGLSSLAVTSDFSFFHQLSRSKKMRSDHFGIFLTEGENGEESEIAIGGHNEARLLEALKWSPVPMAELGYWQVQIRAFRVDGVTLDVCQDGTCRGVVDSGTSHLGIPSQFHNQVEQLLTQDAGNLADCRMAKAPQLEIELTNVNLTLYAGTYMRRLPLQEGVQVGSATGVTMNSSLTASNTDRSAELTEVDLNETNAKHYCRPRIMPVSMPAPLGPKLFILGEPVLHRYYTVFDWSQPRVGFGLAKNQLNTRGKSQPLEHQRGLPHEVEVLLMQKSSKLQRPNKGSVLEDSSESGVCGLHEDTDASIFIQVSWAVAIRRV